MKDYDIIDWINWKGLSTKTSIDVTDNAQLRVAINADHFTQYGAISKPPGSKRVLSSIYKESGAAKKMSAIMFYKAPDLDGQILRHPLVAGGTKLHRIETDGSLTALTGTGKPITETRTEGLVHASELFDDFLLIQNQDPDLVGNGDTPVKYDGNDIHRWGIIPPGSEESVKESFDDASSFTASGVTASDESTTTQDGAATKVDKDSTSQVNGDLTKTLSAFTINAAIPDRAQVHIYIPRGELKNFSEGTTPAVQVFVGDDLSTDFYQFDFDKGDIFEGWNALPLNFYNLLNNQTDSAQDQDDPNVSITGSPGTSPTKVRFRINSSSATTTISGVIWDRFLTFDVGALTATEGGAASDNIFKNGAIYKYKVTYISKYGHESNAGPESPAIELTAARDQIDLTAIPTSSDEQVVARKIYRTANGGEIFLFVDTIDNNTDTTFTDNFADLAGSAQSGRVLGQTSPPLEGDVSDDNSPPPKAGIIKKWKRTVFLAGLPESPDVVVYSEDDESESFPTLNRVRLDAKITAIYETYSGLVIDTELGKWQVVGDNPDFQFDKVIQNIGCVGRRAAGEARISGWAIDREGMRIYDLNNPIKISEVIRDKFEDDFNKANIELLQSTHSKSRNAILMLVADSNKKYTGNNFVYQYPMDQLAGGFWWELQLPDDINPLDIEEIEDTNGTFKLYMGGDDGMVYELFSSGEKNWTLSDGSTEAITFDITTTQIRLGNEENETAYSGRAKPSALELRFSGDASTWTATVSTFNGPSQTTASDSVDVTFDFAAGETVLRLPVKQIRPGEYINIRLKNTEKDVAGTIIGMRLFYRLQPGNFIIETGTL